VAMNSGMDSREVVDGYWKKEGFTIEALLDADGQRGANAKAMGVVASPTNIVVGPDGKVLYASVGFDESRIRGLLGL